MLRTQDTDAAWVPTPAYEAMAEHWPLIDDLLGGTPRMRDAKALWLPKEPRESTKKYSNRLKRSILFPGYKNALHKVIGKPFSKPVAIQNPGAALEQFGNTVDLHDTTLDAFAKRLLREGVHRGIVHVFIDMPVTEGRQSFLEEADGLVRPFFRLVSAKDLIGWQFSEDSSRVQKLSQIRFVETVDSLTDQKYGSTRVEQVRVVNAPVDNEQGTWELWRSDATANNGTSSQWDMDDGSWEMISSGTHSYPGLPFVTMQLDDNEDGEPMVATPLLEDLAYANLAHWQSYSDQRNVLRFARTGTIFAKGMTAEEVEKITIGSDQIVAAESGDANMAIIEYTGKAIEHGRQDLKDLEAQMQIMGAQPFVERTSLTATEVNAGNSDSLTVIQSWIRALEKALENAYTTAAIWLNAADSIPDDFSIDVFSDFAATARSDKDIDLLFKSVSASLITQEVYLRELKRRGVLDDSVDPATQVDETAEADGGVLPDDDE